MVDSHIGPTVTHADTIPNYDTVAHADCYAIPNHDTVAYAYGYAIPNHDTATYAHCDIIFDCHTIA
jgi:hypothetical protein